MITSALHDRYKFRINVRPVKYAYFLHDNDWATLKDIIQLSCTQWGGIRSLIVPVKADLSIASMFEQLLTVHEPDRFVGYLTEDSSYTRHNQLQRKLADLFPTRHVSLEQGQFFAANDMTAHALHVLTDDDLQNRLLTRQTWTPSPAIEHEQIPLAIYGTIYPGQEEYYESTIQLTNENIEIGSKDFWSSQVSSDPFASVINLTASHVSAYRVTNWFNSNEFNVVIGNDVNSVCLYWNLRATREATYFSSQEKRRTLLAPIKILEDPSGLNNLLDVIRTEFPTPGISINLNMVFCVWGEESEKRLRQVLAQSTDQLEVLKEQVHRTRHFGRKDDDVETLVGKKLTYVISWPLLPGSYHEGVYVQPPLYTTLALGKNEVLYEPPGEFRNRSGGGVAIDFECEVWNRFPFDRNVASLINQNGWFSKYGFTNIYSIGDRSSYLAFNLPSEWETVETYFSRRGITIRRSKSDEYSNGVLNVLGGWHQTTILASKPAYLLLDILSLRSTKKISQRIEQALGLGVNDIETIRSLLKDLLQNIETLPELKGIPRTYEQLYNDARLTKYRQQLLGLMSNLSQHQVLKRGLYLYCPNCGAPDWYPLDNLSEEVRCSGCGQQFIVPIEQPAGSEIRWQYRLNTLINRAVDQDVLVPMLAVSFLTHDKEATCRVVGLELRKVDEVLGDLDYVYVLDQKLYAGECKAGSELAKKDLETALLALKLGIAEFRFCTLRRFSSEAQTLIEEARRQSVTAGYPETAISILEGDQLIGETL